MDAEEVDDAQTLSKFQEGIHKESLAQKGVQLSPSSQKKGDNIIWEFTIEKI